MAKGKERKASTELDTDDLFSMMDKEFSKAFKENPAVRLSEYRKDVPKLWYSTGIPSLDIALTGGLAGGRMSEWFGLEGSGKSTILYSSIAEAQAKNPSGFHDYHVIADPENSSSDARKHMELIGVDTSRVHIIAPQEGKPLYAEDIFERIEWILRNPQLQGRIGIIGIDSVAALVSRAEGENANKWDKNARVGGISGIMSRFISNVVDSGLLFESDAHLFLINQVRDNIGDMFNPFRTPGGRKIAFASAQRVEVAKTQQTKDFGNPNYKANDPNNGEAQFIGQRIKFKQVKSKVGGVFGATAAVDFIYNEGLDVVGNAISVGTLKGIVAVGGAWYSLIDVATGELLTKQQGMNAFKKALIEEPDLFAKFDYMLTCVLRGVEPLSVIEDWDKIVVAEGEEDGIEQGEEQDNS